VTAAKELTRMAAKRVSAEGVAYEIIGALGVAASELAFNRLIHIVRRIRREAALLCARRAGELKRTTKKPTKRRTP